MNSISSTAASVGILAILTATACGGSVSLPAVHEPIDSPAWQRCAGELAHRESMGMIDDLTLDGKTLLCQGVVLANEGDVDGAVELLSEAAVREPEDHRPHYMSGRILADAGRFEEALAAYARSQKRFESMEVPAERLGRKVEQAEGADQAMHFLDKARARKLCPYGCVGLLARLHKEKGEIEEARALYKEMVDSQPSEPHAYVGLASILNQEKKYDPEATMLETAIGSSSFSALSSVQQADIYYGLSFARYNKGKYDKAADAIKEAISRVDDRADWHVLAGWIHLKIKKPDGALSAFNNAISFDEKLSAAHIGVGDARVALDDIDSATKSFERALELDPTNAIILLKLADVAASNGDLEKARKLFDDAVRLDKSNLPGDLVKRITSRLD